MPGELLLTSLAGCSGIDVINILTKQRQQVTGLEIRVKGSQLPDPPWTWQEIELEYVVKGRGLMDSAVRRAVHLSETKYCSVGATLGAGPRLRAPTISSKGSPRRVRRRRSDEHGIRRPGREGGIPQRSLP